MQFVTANKNSASYYLIRLSAAHGDTDDGVCSAKRTQVIDDESDYFATDSNQWLTSKQRATLRSKDAEIRAKRHASRRDRSQQVTLDFAGRCVVEEDQDVVAVAECDDFEDVVAEFNPDDFTVDLVNPNISLPAKPQVCYRATKINNQTCDY